MDSHQVSDKELTRTYKRLQQTHTVIGHLDSLARFTIQRQKSEQSEYFVKNTHDETGITGLTSRHMAKYDGVPPHYICLRATEIKGQQKKLQLISKLCRIF